MKCKDIAEEPILRYLAGETDGYAGWPAKGWGNRFVDDDGKPAVGSILNAMPPGIPPKLGLAKAGMMIRRGLITGCTCGCRGDFEITAKGRVAIASAVAA